MGRGRMDQWGIRFGISVNGGGYAWQHVPEPEEAGVSGVELKLAPAGKYLKPSLGVVVMSGATTRTNHQNGLDIAYKAFERFRALAETITRAEPIGERTITGSDGTQATVSMHHSLELAISDEEAREQILAYANRFGTLWGDEDPRSLREWQREASEFLTLYEVSLALSPHRSRTRFTLADFERCVIPPSEDGGRRTLRYWRNRWSSPLLTIATEGDRVESKIARNALPTKTDIFGRAKKGTSRERAEMLFARQINAKLTGGLSLSVSLFNSAKSTVTPLHLLHLLYLRLWLVTTGSERPERQQTCRNCNRPLRQSGSGRPREFCDNDNRCRDEWHNHEKFRRSH